MPAAEGFENTYTSQGEQEDIEDIHGCAIDEKLCFWGLRGEAADDHFGHCADNVGGECGDEQGWKGQSGEENNIFSRELGTVFERFDGFGRDDKRSEGHEYESNKAPFEQWTQCAKKPRKKSV